MDWDYRIQLSKMGIQPVVIATFSKKLFCKLLAPWVFGKDVGNNSWKLWSQWRFSWLWWCQLSRIGGQVWWRFPHRFERTQPSKWFCEVQLPKLADRDVSVKCLLPGHSCVSAQCPSWTFRTAHAGWAHMGLGWQFFGFACFCWFWPIWDYLGMLFLGMAGVIGRLRFEDQTLATWHRGSGIRMGWWPSSRCPLEMGQLGHLWPMGSYGILWAPSKWTTSGLRIQHGHGPYSIGSFRRISFCHFWCEQALMHGTSVPARIADAAPTLRRYAKIRPNPSMKHVPTCNSIAC